MKTVKCMEPDPPGAAFFLPGAGADPIWSEPESAPGPRTSGAGGAKKSGGSGYFFTGSDSSSSSFKK